MEQWKICLVVSLTLFLGLVVLLIAVSLASLEYYNFGFVRSKSTGRVDTGQVYTGGLHIIGPNNEFKVFPATAHYESAEQIAVFTSDRLEIHVSASWQYFLIKEDLHNLHRSFDIYYMPVMRTSAIDAIKGAATRLSTQDFVRRRHAVEETFRKAVRKRLGGTCCLPNCNDTCIEGCKEYSNCTTQDKMLFAELRYFQLGFVGIPEDVKSRYLRSLVLIEDSEQEHYVQAAQLVQKNTDAIVKNIKNTVEEIHNNATARAELAVTVARATAALTVENARIHGLRQVYDKTALSKPEEKSSFQYLRSLTDNDRARLYVDFQQLIAGNIGS